MMVAGPTEKLLWGIILLLLCSYFVGSYLNRRRSKALGKWISSGIPEFGGKPQWKFLGGMTSGGQVTLEATGHPFRKLTIAYMLLTREFAPLWLTEYLKGRRDLLSIRGELRTEPGLEIEILPLAGALRRELDKHAGEQPWIWTPGPHGLGIATRSTSAAKRIPQVTKFLERYGVAVQRLSLRGRQPNLVAFFSLAGLERLPAREVARSVKELTRALGAPLTE